MILIKLWPDSDGETHPNPEMLSCEKNKHFLDAMKYGQCFDNNDFMQNPLLFLEQSPDPCEDQYRSYRACPERGSKSRKFPHVQSGEREREQGASNCGWG